MIIDKKRKEEKKVTIEEPKDRFYVRKWKASKDEMSEVREYIKSHKSKTHKWKRPVDKNKAKQIRKKLVR